MTENESECLGELFLVSQAPIVLVNGNIGTMSHFTCNPNRDLEEICA
jgi:hypothetical protein